MITISEVIALLFIGAGTLFMVIAAIGVLRFPDFFTRLHGAGIGDSFGTLLITIGMIILTGLKILSIKIFLIYLLIMLTNPLGTNMIMIATVSNSNYKNYRHLKVRNKEGGDKTNV